MYRLYVREWVTVHTGVRDPRTEPDPPGAVYTCLTACRQWAEQHLSEVHDDDVIVDLVTNTLDWVKAQVRVRREVLKGEFAQTWAAEQTAVIEKYEDFTIAAKDSAMDREIAAYGSVR